MSWSLEEELLQMSGGADLPAALRLLGLVQGDGPYQLDEIEDWRRSGAETFLYVFSAGSSMATRAFVLKACVPFGGLPPDRVLQDWLGRRAILHGAGVSVPRLFGVCQGTILEEFVPRTLGEALGSAASLANPAVLQSLIGESLRFAMLLNQCGFRPVQPFDDLRSRGDDVVAIDFGSDLGEPGVAASRSRSDVVADVAFWLRGRGLCVDDELMASRLP